MKFNMIFLVFLVAACNGGGSPTAPSKTCSVLPIMPLSIYGTALSGAEACQTFAGPDYFEVPLHQADFFVKSCYSSTGNTSSFANTNQENLRRDTAWMQGFVEAGRVCYSTKETYCGC